jgi:hypothetical protein
VDSILLKRLENLEIQVSSIAVNAPYLATKAEVAEARLDVISMETKIMKWTAIVIVLSAWLFFAIEMSIR